VSVRSSPPIQITSQSWIQHMIHLHSTEGTGKRKRVSRGGHRKRGNEEELVWSLEAMLESQQESRRKKKQSKTACGEEEAVAMEYLMQHHEGNVQAAQSNILTNLSGGQGML
jgi:hypothetical protein